MGHRGALRWQGLRVSLLAVLLVSITGVSHAGAATLDHTITLNSAGVSNETYTMAPDGTFWATGANAANAGGFFNHLNQDGQDLGDGFQITTYYAPQPGPAFYNNRVYVDSATSSSQDIESWITNAGDVDPGYVHSGGDIGAHVGGINLRPLGGGTIYTAGGGQVAHFAANNFSTWLQMGWGINDNPADSPQGLGFETCSASSCGQYTARGPAQTGGALDGADDVAPTNAGFYVSEYHNKRVSYFEYVVGPNGISGPQPFFEFGQNVLGGPWSIVRKDEANGNLFVSDVNTRSIAEFNSAGVYIDSFGFGVLTGANQLETCGPGFGSCQQGTQIFGRLDMSSDNQQLFAHIYGTQQIDVINIGGSSTPPDAKITVKANPLKVDKNDKTKLTATLKPSTECPSDSIFFQRMTGRDGGWDNFGNATEAGVDCKVSAHAKVRTKTKFRAVAEQTNNHATRATSAPVTVKVR